MRCAISLASDNISCMVRLPVRLENTLCGIKTPTAAQTSFTTDNSVMSCCLAGATFHRHANQVLFVQASHRRLAGVGGDVFAELDEIHLLEFTLEAFRNLLL